MESSLRPTPRVTLVICLATAGWAFAFGLGSQLLTLTMCDMGWSNSAIGWNTGVYYLGIAVAAVFVPALMRKWGNYCPVLGMLLSGVTLLAFPFLPMPATWFGLRILNGMAGALSLVPLETYLARGTPPRERSRQFALYAVALTLGGAAGIGAGLPFYQADAAFAFYLGGLCAGGAGLLLWRWLPSQPEEPAEENAVGQKADPSQLLGFGSGWIQGFLEGGLIAFLGPYLLVLGMSHDAAGLMMGVSLAGVILFQVPVGWLADRLGRMTVLLACYGMVLVGLVVLPMCAPGAHLGIWLFLVGACSGALYPLGLALLGDRIPEAGLSRAYAMFMAMECLGSVLGPILMGAGRDWYGESAMFAVGVAAVLLVLLVWLASVCVSRRLVGAKRKQDLQTRGAHATSLAPRHSSQILAIEKYMTIPVTSTNVATKGLEA